MQELTSNQLIQSIVRVAARSVCRRYSQWVTAVDVSQEMWLWMLSNPDRAQELFDKSPAFLARRVHTIGERHARREKAAKSGYDPTDECFYSQEQIAEVLSDAFDQTAAGRSRGGLSDMPTAKPDVWQEWETSLVDVRRGLRLVGSETYAVLAAVHRHGIDVHPGDYKLALREVQKALGGAKPR